MYGIPHCNTVKKCRLWLARHHIDYQFHDFKKEGVTVSQLSAWAQQAGWEKLLNRSGTTWRKLSDEVKTGITTSTAAFVLMAEHTSLIKRPILVYKDRLLVGFNEAEYIALLI
ncbi:MAG: arsenate reductase [Sulfuriferula sp.]